METTNFIQHLLNNTNLHTDRVVECVKAFTDESCEELMRIMSYLTGFVNNPEVNEFSEKIGKDQAKLISYNFFTDRVSYRYLNSRKFKVTEDWVANNDGQTFEDWYNIPTEIRENKGDVEITVKYWSNDSCSLNRWQ